MARSFASASSRYLSYAGAITGTAPFTMACWFNSTTMGTVKTLMSANTAGSANQVHWLRTSAGNKIEAFSRTTTADSGVSTGTYSSGVWAHAAGVYAATNSRTAYLDGVAGSTGTVNKVTAGIDTFYIGRYSSTTQYMNGSIAEAGVWNVALTAAEVAMLAKGYSPLFVRPASLVAYWPLVGRCSPEIDFAGGFNLTLNNSPPQAAHCRIILPASAA